MIHPELFQSRKPMAVFSECELHMTPPWCGPALIRSARKVPHALKLNDDGSPTHPLYLSSKLKPFPMEDP